MVEIDDRKVKVVEALSGFVGDRRVKVLDVGCGDCRYRDVFSKYLRLDHYVGLDRVNKCSGVPVVIADLEDISVDDFPAFHSFFDVVFMFDILEHVTNYGIILKWVRRILVNDGFIVVSTLSIPVDGFYDDIERDVEHVHLYTPVLFDRVLGRHGFRTLYSSRDKDLIYFIAQIIR